MNALGGFVLVGAVLLGAGIAWWLGLGSGDGEPEASAQEVVQNACNNVQIARSYDVNSTVVTPPQVWDGPGATSTSWTITTNFSGEDFYMSAHAPDVPAAFEFIFKDGVVYYRQGEQQGEGEWGTKDREWAKAIALGVGLDLDAQGSTLCPTAVNNDRFTRQGKSTVGSVQTRHFRNTFSVDRSVSGVASSTRASGGSTALVEHHTWDYWVDSNGQLVRILHTIDNVLLPGTTQRHTTRVDSTISGVGEANIITVPVVSGQ